jgi:glucosamine--fructose-6-phosphate aminotransferase (isomerizing)
MSFMAQEAAEAPAAVARFLDGNAAALASLGARLRAMPPPMVLTSARGSSDHAAGFFKYLCEIKLGVPCASIGASVASVYGAPLKAQGALCLTISQSGRSPDIVALQTAARKAGALTVAVVNVEDSPAGRGADVCLPLLAGPERSVAATKSLIVSLAAGAAIVAHWLASPPLQSAIAGLPDALARAALLEWPDLVRQLAASNSLYVLGRGPGLPIAAETALKLKETCAIHAEAYSLAEVMHGPWELVSAGFPVLAYAQNDASRDSTRLALDKIRNTGAHMLVAGDGGLSYAATGEPLLDPIAMMLTAYLAIECAARARGRDPDQPRLLAKVTETI